MSGKSKSHPVMLVLRLICYLTLAAVISSFAALVILTQTGACSSITTGGITCDTPLAKELAGLGLGIVLLTVFTGVPALLAMAGVVFLLYDIFLWRARRNSAEGTTVSASGSIDEVQAADGSKPSFLMFLLKVLGLVMAAVFVFSLVAGIRGGGN